MADMSTGGEKKIKLTGFDGTDFETFKCPYRFLNGCNTLPAELSLVQCLYIV